MGCFRRCCESGRGVAGARTDVSFVNGDKFNNSLSVSSGVYSEPVCCRIFAMHCDHDSIIAPRANRKQIPGQAPFASSQPSSFALSSSAPEPFIRVDSTKSSFVLREWTQRAFLHDDVNRWLPGHASLCWNLLSSSTFTCFHQPFHVVNLVLNVQESGPGFSYPWQVAG